MPKVPETNLQPGGVGQPFTAQRVVAPRDLSARDISNLGAGASRLGSVMFDRGLELQDELDDARVKEAMAALSDQTRNKLRSYKSALGRKAVDGYDAFIEEWETARRDTAELLRTEEQRRRYEEAAGAYRARVLDQASTHRRVQEEAYKISRSQALMKSFEADWLDSIESDPARAEAARQVAETEVRNFGELTGQSAETTQQMIDDMSTRVHSETITRIAEVDSGAAAEYLEQHGDRINPAAKRAVLRTVRSATIKELAQNIVNNLPEGQNLIDSMDQIGSMKAPIEVRDEAMRRARQAASDRYTATARAANEALINAQNWQQLNRNEELPELLRSMLEATGADDDFDVWKLGGGHFITTLRGYEIMAGVTDEELRAYETPEAVRRAYQMELSTTHMNAVLAKWAKARNVEGPEEELTRSEQSDAIQSFLIKKRVAPAFVDSASPEGKKLAQRMTWFHDAVLREHESLGNKPGSVAYDEAINNVWANGGIYNGRWWPQVMLSPDEWKDVRWAVRNGKVITPGSLNPGETFEDALENADRVISPSNFTGQEESTVRRDPNTGEVLGGEQFRVPTREDAIAALKAKNLEPTEPNIALFMAEELKDIDQSRVNANEAADTEIAARRRRHLEALQAQFDQRYAKRVEELLEARRNWKPNKWAPGIFGVLQAAGGAATSPARSLPEVDWDRQKRFVGYQIIKEQREFLQRYNISDEQALTFMQGLALDPGELPVNITPSIGLSASTTERRLARPADLSVDSFVNVPPSLVVNPQEPVLPEATPSVLAPPDPMFEELMERLDNISRRLNSQGNE